MTPRIGTSGTHGVRKGLGNTGSVFLKTRMPRHTIMNANNVPITVMSDMTEAGTNAAIKPTKMQNRKLDFHGVWNFGCSRENTAGTSPSFDMEKNTRDCPMSITRITDENPARIATVTNGDSQA